jgi:hypothetical protein
MARHTKLKIAALAATLVATIGMAGISPASSADSGKTTITNSVKDGNWCC